MLCDLDREMMELRLERWRECMENNGLIYIKYVVEVIQQHMFLFLFLWSRFEPSNL